MLYKISIDSFLKGQQYVQNNRAFFFVYLENAPWATWVFLCYNHETTPPPFFFYLFLFLYDFYLFFCLEILCTPLTEYCRRPYTG